MPPNPGDGNGLHANFKLSSTGEQLLLIDHDDRKNLILDAAVFGALPADAAWARLPDGTGAFALAEATPWTENGVNPPDQAFRRGDGNSDGNIDISDPVVTLLYLFVDAGNATCQKALDADDGGEIEVSDPIYLLAYLYLQGAPPEIPFASCQRDPTCDGLACEQFEVCE